MTRPGRALAALLAAAALAASCGAPLMKLPAGPGTPAPDVREAVAEATAACRSVSTITTEIAVNGSVAGHRLRGHLLAGLAAPASAAALNGVRSWPIASPREANPAEGSV